MDPVAANHCALCNELFLPTGLRGRLPCGHEFHRDCIVKLRRDMLEDACPICIPITRFDEIDVQYPPNVRPSAVQRQRTGIIQFEPRPICDICLVQRLDDDSFQVKTTLPCDHKFCAPCFKTWIMQQAAQNIVPSCPNCRREFHFAEFCHPDGRRVTRNLDANRQNPSHLFVPEAEPPPAPPQGPPPPPPQEEDVEPPAMDVPLVEVPIEFQPAMDVLPVGEDGEEVEPPLVGVPIEFQPAMDAPPVGEDGEEVEPPLVEIPIEFQPVMMDLPAAIRPNEIPLFDEVHIPEPPHHTDEPEAWAEWYAAHGELNWRHWLGDNPFCRICDGNQETHENLFRGCQQCGYFWHTNCLPGPGQSGGPQMVHVPGHGILQMCQECSLRVFDLPEEPMDEEVEAPPEEPMEEEEAPPPPYILPNVHAQFDYNLPFPPRPQFQPDAWLTWVNMHGWQAWRDSLADEAECSECGGNIVEEDNPLFACCHCGFFWHLDCLQDGEAWGPTVRVWNNEPNYYCDRCWIDYFGGEVPPH